MKRSFFGSGYYVLLAVVVWFGFAKVISSFVTIDQASVVVSADTCKQLDATPQDGFCAVKGRLSSTIGGEHDFVPAANPEMTMRLPSSITWAQGPESTKHFPGGYWLLGALLFLSWLILFLPTLWQLGPLLSRLFGPVANRSADHRRS